MTYKPEKGSRQPVVLYDKDNKAIDVSGIEELASVKIDTGKIAGDLKLVKDNQGRLYGKYGEAWIPVKVDSEGRPIISQGPAGTDPWPVQLSGVATDAKLEQARVLLNTISTKDFATQTTLAATLTKLGQLETELATIKANQLSGDQKVTLSGTIPEIWGSSIDDRPPASSVEVGQIFIVANEDLDMWVSNGISWVVI